MLPNSEHLRSLHNNPPENQFELAAKSSESKLKRANALTLSTVVITDFMGITVSVNHSPGLIPIGPIYFSLGLFCEVAL